MLKCDWNSFTNRKWQRKVRARPLLRHPQRRTRTTLVRRVSRLVKEEGTTPRTRGNQGTTSGEHRSGHASRLRPSVSRVGNTHYIQRMLKALVDASSGISLMVGGLIMVLLQSRSAKRKPSSAAKSRMPITSGFRSGCSFGSGQSNLDANPGANR